MKSPLAWLRGARERRSAYNYTNIGPWLRDSAPESVSAQRAEQLSAVAACVGIISGALGSLPPRIHYTSPATGIKAEVTNSPYRRLLENPFSSLGWSEFIETLMSGVLLHGNSIAQLVLDGRGEVQELRYIPWQWVVPLRDLSAPQEFRLLFRITIPNVPPYILTQDQVLFIRDRSDDGMIGRSRISRSAGVILEAESLQTFQINTWRNQAKPSAFVTAGKATSKEGFKLFKAQFEQRNTGLENAGRVIFGDDGATYAPMSMSNQDMQTLDASRFGTEQICRLFNISPIIVGDLTRSSFANATSATELLASMTLSPWCRKVESAFGRAVFGVGSPWSLELDMEGMLRGNLQARFAAWQIALTTGAMTIAEVRIAESLPPLPGTAPLAGDPAAVDDGNVTGV